MNAHSNRNKCNKSYHVSETRRHTNGYTLYKTVIKEFVNTGPLEYISESIIWKRYTEFKTLHQHLFQIHKDVYLPGKFPTFVKPKVFGRFDSTTIQERVDCSQQLLDFATQHLSLYSSHYFVEFFKNSQRLATNSELIKLKESPLEPVKSRLHYVGDVQARTIKTTLNDVDLQLFDPCSNHSTESSEESVRNDWLAIVRGTVHTDHKVQNHTNFNIPTVVQHQDSNALKSTDNDLQMNLTEYELATDQVSTSGIKSPEGDSHHPKSNLLKKDDLGNSSSNCSSLLPCHPSHETLKDINETTSVENRTKVMTDSTINSTVESFGTSKDEHRRSSKARAYLNQIIEHTSDDTVGKLAIESLNCPLQRLGEPNSEIKGSLLDLKRFFRDEIEDESRGSYLVDAAELISEANNAESTQNHEKAVIKYKSAVTVLLQGVQGDTNEIRIQAVRRKTSKYLQKAEKIHEKFVKNMVNNTTLWQSHEPIVKHSFDDAEEVRERSSSNEPHEGFLEYNRVSKLKDDQVQITSPRHTSLDLIGYKVLGVAGKVLLVLDLTDHSTYTIKILQKSGVKRNRLHKAIIPTNVPYMVQLHRFYITDNFIYLVLEHAAGGKLWDQLCFFTEKATTTNVDFINQHHEDSSMVSNAHDVPVDCQESASNILSSERQNNKFMVSSQIEDDMTIANTEHPKLRNSWSFCENDDRPVLKTNIPGENVTHFDIHDVSNSSHNHMFTIDSVSTLSDVDGEVQYELTNEPILEYNDTVPTAKMELVSDDCFVPDLLSEQDLNALALKNDNTHLTPTQRSTIHDTSLEQLQVSDGSPAVSLHSSADAEELEVNIMEAIASSGTQKVVNRMVNEHGISTANPALIFKSPRTRSISTADQAATAGLTFSAKKENTEHVFSEVIHDKICFSLFRRMETAARSELRIPEKVIAQWGAEMVIAIGTLHSVGILCRNLTPNNVLLTSDGHIRLTYFSKWKQVDTQSSQTSNNSDYIAPEINCVSSKKTEACDWWSLGAMLFELLVGKPLLDCHPCGITTHTNIQFPMFVSDEAKSLLSGLLAFHPTQRLGYGVTGLDDLMSHPFFIDVEWDRLVEDVNH